MCDTVSHVMYVFIQHLNRNALHRKNDLAEGSKVLLDTDLKIILLES